MLIEYWRYRLGWVAGALMIMTAVAVIIAQYWLARPTRISHIAGLAGALAIGGLLFIPAIPRIVTAMRLLWNTRIPMDPSGPFAVAAMDVALPSSTGSEPAILVQIWYPAAENASTMGSLSKLAAPIACAKALEGRGLAGGGQQFPILLYAPGGGHGRDDNASTATELASHGYVVMAIDDVEHGPSPPIAIGEIPQPLAFDFASAEAFKNTLRNHDRKARVEAETALKALDRFEACANAGWRARVRFDRVGFFGYSFGGASAAEAGTLDPRVAAVANLDGWLWGDAVFGALQTPYMVILIKEDIFPGPGLLQSRDPNKRYFATLAQRDLREEVRLANRPDGFGFRICTAYHENLCDQIFSRRFFKTWLFADPYRIKSIRDTYLTAFFETYLRGIPAPLLTQSASPFREVETLKGNLHWLNEAAASTAQAAFGPD